MNELRFLEAVGNIDDDLIREADANALPKHIRVRRGIYAFGSVAAAAVITIGSAAFYRAHQPAGLPAGSAAVQQTSVRTDSTAPENPAADSTAAATGTGDSETVTAAVQDSGAQRTPAQDTGGTDAATPRTDAQTAPASRTVQTTAQTVTDAPDNSRTTGGQKGGVSVGSGVYTPFAATVDPDSDAFGDDEVHHVDVRTADGFYRQLSTAEYAANGIPASVSQSDFGGYIGKITEVSSTDYQGGAAESQEPAIAGADVYYYAPSGKNKAFIIVKKGGQCSLFCSDIIRTDAGFRSGLAFYHVQSAGDIQQISYQITVPDNSGRMVPAVQNTLTDAAKVRAVYDLLCRLTPEDYSRLPAHIGTPQWLTDAWAAYRADPDAPARTDYAITLRLKDGTVLQSIHYQPYLGNGYVTGMQELTPEQNAALQALLP